MPPFFLLLWSRSYIKARAYGWVNTAIGIGAVTGAFMIANQHGRSWRGLWLVIAGIAFPIVLGVFAFMSIYSVSLILAFGLGIGFMVQFTMINTLLQTRVEDQSARPRYGFIYADVFRLCTARQIWRSACWRNPSD